MTKIQLPLFKEDLLPTGKFHTSYSEIAVWSECSWRHKLTYIDKLDEFSGNEYTSYGHVLHSYSEHDFLGKTPFVQDGLQLSLLEENEEKPSKNKLIEEAKTALRKDLEKVNYVDKNGAWENGLEKLLEAFPAWMNETFPGWKPVAVEFPLFEKIEDQNKNRYLKGFIDRVIKAPKAPRKDSKPKPDAPIEWEYWVLDLKTTNFGWNLEQKMDPIKRMQLVLYKHYFCKKFNLDLKQVKCAFVLCKRSGGKKNDPFEKIDVSVGPETIRKALETTNSMINSTSKRLFTKDKKSCKFCPFRNTKHCP